MTRRHVPVLVAAAALLLLAAGPLPAQTPATGLGLGYPVAPVDARAAALGGVSSALPGGSLSARSPAALTTFDRVTLGFTLSPESADVRVTETGPAQTTGRSRFTVARVVVPFGDWRVAAGFSPELDQDWRVALEDTLSFAGEAIPFRERRVSDGGLSAADLSLARRIGPVTIGVGGDRLTGSLDRSFRRTFRPDTAARTSGPTDVQAAGSWAYSGWRARGGLAVDIGTRARLDVSGAVAGDLTAEPDGPAETRTYDYPASLSASAAVRLTQGVLLTGGGGWTGWSSLDDDLRETRAEDTRWAGGGVEISNVQLGPVAVPFRLGGRIRELPFAHGSDLPFGGAGGETLTERSLTAGFSARGGGGDASIGFSMELGTRGDVSESGLAEDFQRFYFTLQIRN